jgi:hypothetical protein
MEAFEDALTTVSSSSVRRAVASSWEAEVVVVAAFVFVEDAALPPHMGCGG